MGVHQNTADRKRHMQERRPLPQGLIDYLAQQAKEKNAYSQANI